jgi:mRNA interferase RelE/StbE
MNYEVILTTRAARDLRRLSPDVRERVLAAMMALENDPRPPGCCKLSSGAEWRIRAGDYRILYLIDDPARRVTITHIGHRRNVYDS